MAPDSEATPSLSRYTGLVAIVSWERGRLPLATVSEYACVFSPSWSVSSPQFFPVFPPAVHQVDWSPVPLGYLSLRPRSALSCPCCVTGESSFRSTPLPLKLSLCSMSSICLMLYECIILLRNPNSSVMWILSVLFLFLIQTLRTFSKFA